MIDEHGRGDKQLQLEEMRRLTAELRTLLAEDDDGSNDIGISVVRGQDEIMFAYENLMGNTENEFWGCDRPPYADQRDVVSEKVEVFMRKKVEGIRFRMLFDTEVVNHPTGLQRIRGARMSGQEVRLISNTPFKIAISDRSSALVAPGEGSEVKVALLMRASPMVDVLIGFFETFWAAATPLRTNQAGKSDHIPVISDQEHDLLALLVADLTEEQIANRLGLSERTARRKIRDLMNTMGAETRFQAGVKAARLGWF